MDIHILPLSSGTVPAVAELEKACFADPWSLEAIRSELDNPLCVFYTALVEGGLAGYGGMHHILDEGHITNIAVAPAFRRRGVASALLQALIGYARVNQLEFLTLEVRASNAGAIALYEAFGFSKSGERPGYYKNPAENALLLTKIL